MALRSQPPVPHVLLATTFTVGRHAVKVSRSALGRWTATVDDGPPSNTFDTQVDAWEAGVREADRLDRANP
jgi:hypothetical protein